MRPDDHDIDDELRTHLEISTKERIARGEDPETARLAALRELGYVPAVHDSVRRVWYSRWLDALAALAIEMRVGFRSLMHAKGLTITVVITLALGIGANAAIFSVVRGVLLRPLVNRGEDRLVYIRQGAPGLGIENLTFSVPEYEDVKAGSKTIESFGEFSTTDFTMMSNGEPRLIHAGVVGGSYFDVVGLRPVLGRLINTSDDGKLAAPVVVLTHRFWTTLFNSDPAVVGRPIQLGSIAATIVGVLEPSIPYPVETEIIANMVSSPHHLGAQMNTVRVHRMTELFGRLAPGASVEAARAELKASFAAMINQHPETYSPAANMQLSVTPLREQITAPARTILLLLLTAAGVVFIIACSNIANLILARSVRREGELAVRAALGASTGALRRTLLAESLVLCGAGAILGIVLAQPMLSVVTRFAARFSVRALEVQVDGTLLWVGGGLAIAAAVLLAYVPRLPSSSGPTGFGLAGSSLRLTPGTNRRLRAFATAQIAFSFVLLAAAGALVTSLVALQSANTGFITEQVLVFDVFSAAAAPTPGQTPLPPEKRPDSYREVSQRIAELPGVNGVTGGFVAPWRDKWAPIKFAVEGYTPANGEEDPYARNRPVGPNYFSTLGIRMIAGREFNDRDRTSGERVVIVSQSLAQRLFPNGEALNRQLWQTASMNTADVKTKPQPNRIIGVAADVDDEATANAPAMAIYFLYRDKGLPFRMFVRTSADPHTLVPSITRIIRERSTNQAVDRAATLAEVRAEVLTPERLNAFVVTGFAGIALLIAVVGVAGVLAFSVSARMREFGVRLAIGSAPRDLLLRIVSEGAWIVAIGIVAGAAADYGLSMVAASYFEQMRVPGALPTAIAAAVLGGAAVLASLMPAARAARVDVLHALRSE